MWIWVPNGMDGYLENRDATKIAFRDGGWYPFSQPEGCAEVLSHTTQPHQVSYGVIYQRLQLNISVQTNNRSFVFHFEPIAAPSMILKP